MLVALLSLHHLAAQVQDKNLRVVYPYHAIHKGIEGTSELRVALDRRGYIIEITVEKSSGSKILDEAALGSVYQWVFKPDKRKARREFIIPIRFAITADSIKEMNQAQRRNRPKPWYPYQAHEKNLSGNVTLRCYFSERGFVEQAAVHKSSGYPELDYSALITAYRYAENPTNVAPAGTPIEQTIFFKR